MGWELKLGIIVPSWNTVMEYETQRLAAMRDAGNSGGTGASVHAMRIAHTADSEENLIGLSTQAPDAARVVLGAMSRICRLTSR